MMMMMMTMRVKRCVNYVQLN